MFNYKDHIISSALTIKEALAIIDEQGLIANVLFVEDQDKKLAGSISDGDIRRGLLKGVSINDTVSLVMRTEFKFLHKNNITPAALSVFRDNGIFCTCSRRRKVNYRYPEPAHLQSSITHRCYYDGGGKGQRLLPLTKDTPKPC